MSTYSSPGTGAASVGSLLQLDGPIPYDGAGPPPPDILRELRRVQGNILQPHGRRFALHVLLRFTSPDPARAWLAWLADQLTTAADELTARLDNSRRPLFLSLAMSAHGLSAAGYALGSDRGGLQAVFSQGMARRQAALSDPPRAEWEPPYREGCDGLLIVAANDPEEAWRQFRTLFADRPIDGVAVVGVEIGQRMNNNFGQDVEHFGYVDGTSQPLFLLTDVKRDEQRHRIHDWSPAFPPRQVLVACPGGYGSYLVFRKLEQNLAAFAATREQLRARMGDGDSALAGASIVGRYEDGRPAGLRDRGHPVLPVENGFLFDSDPPACPIGSHVRIVNPRTDRDRSRMIARRGIPYGRPPNGAAWTSPTSLPPDGFGLLFMAYMADIGAQFEAIQIAANGAGGLRDPLIGQGPDTPGANGTGYGGAPVRLRGGEYFLAPPPALLAGVADAASSDPATTSDAGGRRAVGSYERL